MRLLPLLAVGLAMASLSFPNAVANYSNTIVYIVTDTATWESSGTTVDDGTLTDFTVTSGSITLDTVVDQIVATGSTTPSCTVEIEVNGGSPETISCSGGFRMFFAAQSSTYALGILQMRAVAGYAETMMPSPNSHWHGTHAVREDINGERKGFGECEECTPGGVPWSNLQNVPITCPSGATLREWTNISTPDGFFRSLGPRAVGTC